MIQAISERDFRPKVLASALPVLVNFGAPWCGLCRLIQPTVASFERKHSDRITVVNVNADDNFKLVSNYRLSNIPTLLLIVNGQVVERLEGFRSREELQLMLEHIGSIDWLHREAITFISKAS
jgi:thioredoxin 1